MDNNSQFQNNLPVPVLADAATPTRSRTTSVGIRTAGEQGEARESTKVPPDGVSGQDSRGGQFISDSWEAIEAQLDYWAQMDAQYWLERKEKEYTRWLQRTYGI